MCQCHHKVHVKQEMPDLNQPEDKGESLADGWQLSGRSKNSMDCLLPKLSDSKSAIPTNSHTSPPPSPTSRGSYELKPNTADLTVYLSIHKTIPVSDTELTLGLRVGFITSHVAADKLFSVHPTAITGLQKMNLLLEAQNTPALINKPRLIICCRHWWVWLVHNVQPAATNARSEPQQDFQQTKCFARADPVLHHILYFNWLDV